MGSQDYVTVGRVLAPYGIKGWVKVQSYTRPPEAILDYRPWWLSANSDWHRVSLLEGRTQGKGIVVLLEGVVDRSAAEDLKECEIAIEASQLPALPSGSYYWMELEGLTVRTLHGKILGQVSHLFETGANDVMVVKPPVDTAGAEDRSKELLVPYIRQVIQRVDLTAGIIEIDWDPES